MVSEKSHGHFLVVGLGSIGKRHVRNLRELFPGAEITVLRHGDGCRDLQSWTSAGADHCVGSLGEAIARQPFAAIVANPASCHLKTASVLAENGIHLFIEKPLSHTSDGISIFLSLCNEKKIHLMVGYNLRFTSALQTFRKMISEQVIGRVLSVKSEVGQYLPDWRPECDYRQCVSAAKETGGGVLLELSHEIDYLLQLFGEVESVRGIVSRQGDLEIDVEDTAHIVLAFKPREKQKRIVVSLSMDFLRHDPTRCCTVTGTSGTLRWDGIADTVEKFDCNTRSWEQVSFAKEDRNDAYKQELAYFFQDISRKRKGLPLSSVLEAATVLEIIEAIRLSSEREKTVFLNRGEGH